MKNVIIITYALLLTANTIIGLILSGYDSFNMWLATATIAINGIFSYAIAASGLQNTYKISLTGICTAIMFVQIILAVICDKELVDNMVFIFYILSYLVQGITGTAIYNVSKK